MPNRMLRLLLALHRLLLSAYPREFRSAFGEEMQLVFAQALVDATRRDPLAATAALMREAVSWPALILAAHWQALRQPRSARLAADAGRTEAAIFSPKTLKLFSGLAVLSLAMALWLAAILGLALGFLGVVLPSLVAAVPIMGLLAWALSPLFRRVGNTAWLVAGAVVLVGLAWPTHLVVDSYFDGLAPAFAAAVFVWPSLALVLAGPLFAAALVPAPPTPARRWRAACLILAVALVAKTSHNLYWLLVWDSTYDPLTFMWLIPPAWAAVFAGAMLAIGLTGRSKRAGWYGALVLALLPLILLAAQRVDFRALTAIRAERVSRALAAYYADRGHYPTDLAQLRPWHLLTVSEPVIIRGQAWCYEGGGDQYRLGYVDRAHWSDPNLVGTLHSSAGAVNEAPPLCQAEIAALRASGR